MTHVQKHTAQLLKEKGFDLSVLGCYDIEGDELHYYPHRDWNNSTNMQVSAPKLCIATYWLRETKGVHVVAVCDKSIFPIIRWTCYIERLQKGRNGIYLRETNNRFIRFDTHDEALEAGIVHALKNYVK